MKQSAFAISVNDLIAVHCMPLDELRSSHFHFTLLGTSARKPLACLLCTPTKSTPMGCRVSRGQHVNLFKTTIYQMRTVATHKPEDVRREISKLQFTVQFAHLPWLGMSAPNTSVWSRLGDSLHLIPNIVPLALDS